MSLSEIIGTVTVCQGPPACLYEGADVCGVRRSRFTPTAQKLLKSLVKPNPNNQPQE